MLRHCGVAEAGVSGNVVLASAAAELGYYPAFCGHLASALSAAVDAVDNDGDDACRWQPQTNVRTVFAVTWHAASLARLPDAELAHAWRLADYLMADTSVVRCLQDVAVQRRARTGVARGLLRALPTQRAIRARLAEVMDVVRWHVPEIEPLVRGLRLPRTESLTALWIQCSITARWGHAHQLLALRALGVEWGTSWTANAAYGGQLPLLQRLVELGCPWDDAVVSCAASQGHLALVLWALRAGAPSDDKFWRYVVTLGRRWLPVLQWALDSARLSRGSLGAMIDAAADDPYVVCMAEERAGHTEVWAWYKTLPAIIPHPNASVQHGVCPADDTQPSPHRST